LNYSTRIRYVMQYVNGPNLKIFTRRYTYSLYNCNQWVLQIALALQYLHENNIIHRDIKPENVIVYNPYIQSNQLRIEWNQNTIKESKIKIVDFGMCKQLLDQLTTTNTGTPLYQSPENAQLIGHDSSTDIWSLGIVILELLLRLQFKKVNKNYSDHDFF
jgi:serine/threonine protein kinase